jgi:alkane 1-monooxygenase
MENAKKWRNRKDWLARILLFLPFLLSIVFLRKVPVVHFMHPRWVLVAVVYAYALPPLMDLIGGQNRTNNHPLRRSWSSTALEYVYLPRILGLKVMVLKLLMLEIVARGRFDVLDCLGIAYLTGQSISSYGIFIAHELLHRRSRFDKALSEIMMVTVMYPHFCIEHLYGHHKYAATAKDPASARSGESLYSFLPRSIFGGIHHAWQLETRRLARSGHHWFDYRNRMLRYLAEVLALIVAVLYFFGSLGLFALIVQSLVAVITLEVINYVQHYGLQRKEISPGQYENTGIAHSWNSECWFSNGYWLNLGRHSDHHYAPGRGFQMLRNFEREPELPAGFPAMFLLAFVPPIWFRIMNPRVAALDPADALADRSPAQLEEESEANDVAADAAVPVKSSSFDWRSSVINGSGILMGVSVCLLLVVDVGFGYPRGLITITVVCLCVVAARRVLTRDQVAVPA